MSGWRIKIIGSITFLSILLVGMIILSTSTSQAQENISSLSAAIKEHYDNVTPMYIHFVVPINGDDFWQVPFDFMNDNGATIAWRVIRDIEDDYIYIEQVNQGYTQSYWIPFSNIAYISSP